MHSSFAVHVCYLPMLSSSFTGQTVKSEEAARLYLSTTHRLLDAFQKMRHPQQTRRRNASGVSQIFQLGLPSRTGRQLFAFLPRCRPKLCVRRAGARNDIDWFVGFLRDACGRYDPKFFAAFKFRWKGYRYFVGRDSAVSYPPSPVASTCGVM